MNRTQKGAIYGLILTACMLFIPLFDFLESRVHLSFAVKHLLLLFWIILLVGPVWLIERRKSAAPFDERDKQICIRAAIAAFTILFLGCLAAYTVILFRFESFTLETRHLPILIYGTLSAFIFLLSVGVLVQYILHNHQGERSIQ